MRNSVGSIAPPLQNFDAALTVAGMEKYFETINP